MNIKSKICNLLQNIKAKKPLVHHITNYVTVNDCANVALAIGGSPIMADDIGEVEDIVGLSSALVVNMGTLNERTIKSMLTAGKKANALGVPVIFDPVGAGASDLRNRTAQMMINEVELAVIRGNMSEIKSISGLESKTKGVDVSERDIVQAKDLEHASNIARKLSNNLNCVIAITGATDIISDGKKAFFIDNGHPMLSSITGTGCMCTSLIGVYSAVTDDYLSAATAGVSSMGIAGEIAYHKLIKNEEGSGGFRIKLMDSIYRLSADDIMKRGKINEE